ncbi:MAG: thiamine biosynthesis lipoprotein [Phycisphaerales bacterium]|jgi:thiamine biosynthesis lipoprotein
MGSRARVVLYAPNEPAAARAAADAFEEMARLEAVMSDYRPDSEAMRLCAKSPKVWHPVSRDLLGVLGLSERVWAASNGAFDVTVGPMTRRWRESRKAGTLPTESELADLRDRVGFGSLMISTLNSSVKLDRRGMSLDFGGVGKGYAAQAAVDRLTGLGHPECLVEIGGDLAIGAAPPGKRGWSIAIETGLGEGDREDLRLHDVGVATSGDAEQFVEIQGVRYSHIVDPKTGLGLTERIAVTVTADRSAGGGGMADAAASAISVLGAERGQAFAKKLGVRAFIVRSE